MRLLTMVGAVALVAVACGGDDDAPEGMAIEFSEDWSGPDTDPWNATRWPDNDGDGSATIDSNRGRMLVDTEDFDWIAKRADVEVGDFDLTVQFEITSLLFNRYYIHVRASGLPDSSTFTGYSFNIRPESQQAQVTVWSGGNSVTEEIDALPDELYVGTVYHWRVQGTGDGLRQKIWQDGNPEPETWLTEINDSTQASGEVWLGATRGDTVEDAEIFWNDLEIEGTSGRTVPASGDVHVTGVRVFPDSARVRDPAQGA